MDFRLHLVIEDIQQLPAVSSHDCRLIVGVEWRGRRKKRGILEKGIKKNYTCQQRVQESGTAIWNEEFDHTCKFKKGKSSSFRKWVVGLQIVEVKERVKDKLKITGKAKLDVTEYVQFENEKNIRIPISCSIRGHSVEAMLMVKLQLIRLQSLDRKSAVIPTRVLHQNSSSQRPKKNSTKLIRNHSVDLLPAKSSRLQKRRSTMATMFTCHKPMVDRHISSPPGSPTFPNKACSGGADFDHHKVCMQMFPRFKQVKVRPEDTFEAGQWRRRKIVSRDKKMELIADVFHASIDQCSKRAAGGSACTVLAAVLADWLHNNPKSLPLENQLFDELILKGSSDWRNLCEDGNNKVKFSDKHFDLDTVLEEKVRSLAVITDKSCVGFFEVPQGFACLEQDMSFDAIWNGILCTEESSEEKIYIASWNDHFFVLKVGFEAIYLLDTLGERLLEGCNQAYILKFDEESEIKENGGSHGLMAKGIECCKEYIKGFLSAIPLRQLQEDIKKGRAKQEILYRLLQIDFHFTVPAPR